MIGGEHNLLRADPLPWLLEPDEANPGVRYFALRDLLGRPPDDPEVVAARAAVMRTGPVPVILDAQYPAGYWVRPGPGYSPKYRATLWQVLFLAQLGADGRDERVRRAVEYVFAHAQAENGAFSPNGSPGRAVHCLWGNMVWALSILGYGEDGRLARSVEALARSVTGDGYPWYRRSGIQGPGFLCAVNDGLPCAWGAVRVLWAFNRLPDSMWTPLVEEAAAATAEFLLRCGIARTDSPRVGQIRPGWFRFGYPLGYVTDLLLCLEVLAEAGRGGDPRLEEVIALVLSKQDERGRWRMEYSYNGRMWADVEVEGRPSKWVTLRAVRTLRLLG